MHSHCRAYISGLQKQRLSWPLLIYRARVYQEGSIAAALGAPVPSYLLCETSKANLSAWELLIFDPLCAPSTLSFQATRLFRKWLYRHCLNLFQNPFSHHLGCPCLQQYFWYLFKAWKGEKELQSYNSPFCKYPSHADVSVPANALCRLLITKRISTSYHQGFWASRIFILWRKKGLFTAAVGQLLEQEDLCNTAMDKQAQRAEKLH